MLTINLSNNIIRRSSMLLVFLLTVLFPFYYYNAFILEHINRNFQPVKVLKISQFSVKEPLIVFPHNFKEDGLDLEAYYSHSFNLSQSLNIVKFNGHHSSLTSTLVEDEYAKHEIKLYDSNTDSEDCSNLNKDLDLEISKFSVLDNNFDMIIRVLIDQLDNDDALKELKGFFKDDLTKQLNDGTLDKHWFKFAGTSVWLEQYGVHFMISRMLYSAKGNKRDPNLSLTYAQIFNENWEELENIELIIPTRDPTTNDMAYKNLKFPYFLPIPFYHNSDYQSKRFYGPEDARMLLIKNDLGNEEPLIIFNAYHRKIVDSNFVDESHMNIMFKYYRSMFMSWPFQFQLGKENIDGIKNPRNNNIIYNKAIELKRENFERLDIQKNWTPFISLKERKEYDTSIYFIYRWSNLEILKCQLTDFGNEGISNCHFVYKRDPELPTETAVGPLRGGTELISLNKYIASEKEIWIGFARAHLKGCGCGRGMYRPNLAVIVKDGGNYKINQLSSYMSLDIPVDGWTVPEIQCADRDPSALIPNGISAWEFKDDHDYLTLTLSVADDSVHLIHIKDLFKKSIDLFAQNNEIGYNDNIVKCSLQSSKDFCSRYGKEYKVTKE